MNAPPNGDAVATQAPPIVTFANSYARLPERFFAVQAPVPVAAPRLVALNTGLAEDLGLAVAGLPDAELAAIFAGNRVPPGAAPLAAAYAGHQFGGFSPQLGDGRAILLGEVIDREEIRRDIQLKGSGRTPFSRGGDGRAALGPVLREYLLSEAMHALGIPTTRALAAVTTGEIVYRERTLPGAIVTRVAASHVRVGTFQYFAARRDEEALRILADYVIARHYPASREAPNPILAMLEAVMSRQAALVARWMQVGFIHGVMNTDNMAISGETIDYGPCAFMEAFDPASVFSAIDEGGRYAYGNQPRIAHWNLTRLAEALLPLIDDDPERAVAMATHSLSGFAAMFEARSLDGLRAKLGLQSAGEGDRDLAASLLGLMQANAVDFTVTFRLLCDAAETGQAPAALTALFEDQAGLNAWLAQWRQRLAADGAAPQACAAAMRAVNPAYIPRNHRVEQALAAAIDNDDFSVFHTLRDVLSRPYEEQPGREEFALPALPGERVLRTFCGT